MMPVWSRCDWQATHSAKTVIKL